MPVVKVPKVRKKNGLVVVDGIALEPNAQPLQCQVCGAIWQRLRYEISTTSTADRRCATCNHDLRQLEEVK